MKLRLAVVVLGTMLMPQAVSGQVFCANSANGGCRLGLFAGRVRQAVAAPVVHFRQTVQSASAVAVERRPNTLAIASAAPVVHYQVASAAARPRAFGGGPCGLFSRLRERRAARRATVAYHTVHASPVMYYETAEPSCGGPLQAIQPAEPSLAEPNCGGSLHAADEPPPAPVPSLSAIPEKNALRPECPNFRVI